MIAQKHQEHCFLRSPKEDLSIRVVYPPPCPFLSRDKQRTGGVALSSRNGVAPIDFHHTGALTPSHFARRFTLLSVADIFCGETGQRGIPDSTVFLGRSFVW